MKITANMTIAQILEKNSKHATKLAEIMFKHGLHCVGCPAGQFENLKDGCLGHGMSEEEFEILLKELNNVVAAKEKVHKKKTSKK
jgi:hybrid cluster-associated redox disulfide protein